mmetsp:Transcript_41309/g.125013  ORF Transcript_41309/g.125013 Transcript_41309/m.125013 type:complete len:221 (-) Transcript_41309:304-966(-)
MKVLQSILLFLAAATSSVTGIDTEDYGSTTGPPGTTHPLHSVVENYYTGSCSCVQDAITDIMAASVDAIEKLPFDMADHPYLMQIVDDLSHCAVAAFHGLDCGCDDDHWGIPQQGILAESDSTTSTYQCCCDVEAVKDAVIHHIDAVACSWGVDNMGNYNDGQVNKLCTFKYFTGVANRIEYLVNQVFQQYLPAIGYGVGTLRGPYTCVLTEASLCPAVP